MKFKINPGVIWITGLSGAGKTTVAEKLYNQLIKKYSNIKILDGDILRKKLNIKKTKKSFTYSSRKKVGIKYSKICKTFENKGFLVIISVMALIEDVYKWNKKSFKNYLDVYLKVPIKILKRRDPKEIYKRFYEKKIFNVQGLDLAFDEPEKPFLKISWRKGINSNIIVKKLKKKILNHKFN
jgi:cytidine diphosphoramidate kinase